MSGRREAEGVRRDAVGGRRLAPDSGEVLHLHLPPSADIMRDR